MEKSKCLKTRTLGDRVSAIWEAMERPRGGRPPLAPRAGLAHQERPKSDHAASTRGMGVIGTRLGSKRNIAGGANCRRISCPCFATKTIPRLTLTPRYNPRFLLLPLTPNHYTCQGSPPVLNPTWVSTYIQIARFVQGGGSSAGSNVALYIVGPS